MALLPPPDIGAAYVDDAKRPSKDFYNWIKSLYDNVRTASQNFTQIFFNTGDDNGISDRSSLLSNGGTFWDSNMHRMNRLFVGIAATVDGNNVPQTPTVLSSTYNFAWTQNSQLGVMSSMGLNAITATSRASDWVTYSSTASQGSQAFTGFGFNDDTTTASGSIAVGANLIGVATAGSKGITIGTQNDVNSARAPVTIDPFTGFTAGTTMATLSTAGAFTSAATQDCSAAYVAAAGTGGTKFNAGVVVMAGSLSVTAGLSKAMSLPQNCAIVWYSGAGTPSGSIYVDGSGNMNINCAGIVKINGVALTVP